ncbi:MAG: gliding motility-associated C-terminal domain-containing protein [Muribaculaceae bacterium]|nr:gliding motility-associated C-terminal domain-containing protein [Muribaculaceae bacterium]
MKYLSLLMSAMAFTAQASITIVGSPYKTLTPDPSSGLEAVYVVRDASDAHICYTGSGSAPEWSMYSNLGGGYAQEIPYASDGNSYTVPVPDKGMGYIITENGRQHCFWVINYEAYPYTISEAAADGADCDRVRLSLQGTAPEMPYYSVNGRHLTVDRQINISFHTLVFESESFSYEQTDGSTTFSSASDAVYVPSPLCDTEFTIHPDRFASEWNLAREVSTGTVKAYAVACETEARQESREVDNEQKSETESLGGSAPCEITFRAAVTDAAIFRRWEVASTPDFIDTYLTFNDTEFTYTFTEAGSTYIRFTADNAEGSCEQQSEVYTVSIGESRLDCPNIFTPGSSEGVNDEWKVSYRSIVEFDCHIFNRWGKTLAHLTDPSQGWDGKVGGKTVGSGVYFYVIKARGADGKDYKLSGDINVINSRREATTAPIE